MPIPEWQCTPETLATLDTLIVPHATVFDEATLEALRPWIAAGGRLLVTGDSGIREGEAGNFAQHGRGPLHVRLAGDNVYAIADNIGMTYYLEDSAREALLPAMTTHLRHAQAPDAPPLVTATGIPSTTGITPYYDPAQPALFVDVNNLALDRDADTIVPTGPVAFEISLPESLRDVALEHRVLSPEEGVRATVEPAGEGRVRVKLSPITYYASVKIVPGAGGLGVIPTGKP